jgi:transposase
MGEGDYMAKKGGPKGLRLTSGTMLKVASAISKGTETAAAAAKKFAKPVTADEVMEWVKRFEKQGPGAFDKQAKARGPKAKSDETLQEHAARVVREAQVKVEALQQDLAEAQGELKKAEKLLKVLES